MNDPFKILGVSRTATPDEIKSAYRKLSLTCHPDVNPGNPNAQAEFCALTAARDVLLDDTKRRAYILSNAFQAPGKPVKRILVSLDQIYAGATVRYTDSMNAEVPLCLKTLPLGQTIGLSTDGILLELKQDQPGLRFAIVNSNIILDYSVNLGNILDGYTLAFEHPRGKMVIRDTWGATHMGVKTVAYPDLGLPIWGTARFGQLIVKLRVNLVGLDRIPAELRADFRARCPFLFAPSPVEPDGNFLDISGRAVHPPAEEDTGKPAETSAKKKTMAAGGYEFGVEMTGCAQS